MKLTKSKLKQIIKEELSLLGSLDIEENFVKKNEIQLNEGPRTQNALWAARDMEPMNVDMLQKISVVASGLSDLLKPIQEEEWPEKRKSREDLEEEKNPWAICTDSVGREDKEKYEKCVKSVKKQNQD